MEVSEPAAKRPCKSGARKTPFQPKHVLQYGLHITARDPQSSEVVAVRCQFCVCFGREGSAKKSSTSWTFEGPPFRTDNYTQHHRLNHKSRWEEYQKMSPEENRNTLMFKHAESICHSIENRSASTIFVIRKPIVDVIIGDMLWHESQMEGQTRANALSLFKPKYDGDFIVEINQAKQFLLATRFIGSGMSFSMAADAIQDVKEICDIPKLGVCNDYLVASYTRAACAISLENIAQILGSKWAFSVAFDASNDMQQASWIDIRVRFFQKSSLENLHLITVPFSGRHTGLAMFDMFTRLFGAI